MTDTLEHTATEAAPAVHVEIPWKNLAALASVSASCASDDARPILTAVHLTSEEGRIVATATDSYSLAVVDVADGGISWDHEPLDVLIPAAWLNQTVRALKVTRYPLRPVMLSVVGETVTLSTDDTVLSTRVQAGTYHTVRHLIPAVANYQSELGAFNADFMARMAKIAPELDKKLKSIGTWRCMSMSRTLPSVWERTTSNAHALFLIMPVRIN